MPTIYKQDVRHQHGFLKICELMNTVQGEGQYIGVPSVFVRTGVCNLSCPGCDTVFNSWAETPTKQVAEMVKAYDSAHVVLTGGEPLLWQDELASLIELLPNHIITVESNASVPLRNADFIRGVDLFSFSPKVGSLGREEKFSERVCLENISKTAGHNQLKFVLDPSNAYDVNHVFSFLAEVEKMDCIPDQNIWFQPYDKGCEVNVLQRIVPFNLNEVYNRDLARLTQLVMERSQSRYRVVPQLHKYINFR